MCQFRRDRVSISSGARKPRSCRFQRDRVSISPGIDWSSLEIGSDLENLYRGGKLWERGDRGVEKVSTEIGNQGARNGALEQARLCSRSATRSIGGEGRSAAQSTGVHDMHKVSPVDRPVNSGRERSTGPVDRSRLGPVDRCGRPWHGWSTGRSTDRRIWAVLSGFGFLFCFGSNSIGVS